MTFIPSQVAVRLPSNRPPLPALARWIPVIAFCDGKEVKMKSPTSAFQVFRRGVGVAMVVLVCGQAVGVAAQDRSEKKRRFEADRQACLLGKTGQSYQSCMREAHAVLADKPSSIAPTSAEQLQRNALARCDAQTGDDHAACVARVRGEGTVSGSVAGGGILHELVTPEVAPDSPQ